MIMNAMMSKDEKRKYLSLLKEKFNFTEIPDEGGLLYQSHVSDEKVKVGGISDRYQEERAVNSVIYFLLDRETPGCFSAMHRLETDETYHFYFGDPVELLLLHPDGRTEIIILGSDIANGQSVQHTVKRGIWQGSQVIEGGLFAFMAASMSPGFDTRDFTLGKREALQAEYTDSEHYDLIEKLTRG